MKNLGIVFLVFGTLFSCSVVIPNCDKCVNVGSDDTISSCESCKTGFHSRKEINSTLNIEYSCFKNSENCHIYNEHISECMACDSASTFATSKDDTKYCKQKEPLLSVFLYLLFFLIFFIIYCSLTLKIVFTSDEFSTFIKSLRPSPKEEKNIDVPDLPIETE